MIPDQTRAVDPFSTYKSVNVNKLTRVLTDGNDLLCRGSHLLITKDPSDDSILRISEGSLIKDDVYIQFKNQSSPDDYFLLDIKNPDNYSNQSLITGSYPFWTYVVVDYKYQEVPAAPNASIIILEDKSLITDDRYFFLGMIEFLAEDMIGQVLIEDTTVIPTISRQYANFTDPYTDTDVLSAFQNFVQDTATVVWDFTGGNIKATSVYATSARNSFISWMGSSITITHNSNSFPVVQIIDNDPASLNYRKLVQGIVRHTSLNEFTLTFDTDTTHTPYNVIVVY